MWRDTRAAGSSRSSIARSTTTGRCPRASSCTARAGSSAPVREVQEETGSRGQARRLRAGGCTYLAKKRSQGCALLAHGGRSERRASRAHNPRGGGRARVAERRSDARKRLTHRREWRVLQGEHSRAASRDGRSPERVDRPCGRIATSSTNAAARPAPEAGARRSRKRAAQEGRGPRRFPLLAGEERVALRAVLRVDGARACRAGRRPPLSRPRSSSEMRVSMRTTDVPVSVDDRSRSIRPRSASGRERCARLPRRSRTARIGLLRGGASLGFRRRRA